MEKLHEWARRRRVEEKARKELLELAQSYSASASQLRTLIASGRIKHPASKAMKADVLDAKADMLIRWEADETDEASAPVSDGGEVCPTCFGRPWLKCATCEGTGRAKGGSK